MATTYKTFGDAISDPDSSISRFIRRGEEMMRHNPTTEEEWAAYMTWQGDEAKAGRRDYTTETWRRSLDREAASRG